MTERAMSINFAVFNGHVNDADKRSRALMRALMPEWLEAVERIESDGNGIMAIFQVEIEPATAAYTALVTAFVNEDRELIP